MLMRDFNLHLTAFSQRLSMTEGSVWFNEKNVSFTISVSLIFNLCDLRAFESFGRKSMVGHGLTIIKCEVPGAFTNYSYFFNLVKFYFYTLATYKYRNQ